MQAVWKGVALMQPRVSTCVLNALYLLDVRNVVSFFTSSQWLENDHKLNCVPPKPSVCLQNRSYRMSCMGQIWMTNGQRLNDSNVGSVQKCHVVLGGAKLLFEHCCICTICKRCICAIWIGVVQSGGAFVQWTMWVLVHHFFVFDSASPLAHICVCTIHYFSLCISATHFLPQCITLCNTKNQKTLDIFCRKAEDSLFAPKKIHPL